MRIGARDSVRLGAVCLTGLFLLPALTPAQVEPKQESGVVTGPIAEGRPAVRALNGAVNSWNAGIPSSVGGTDIRANTATTQGQNETSISINPTNPKNWVGVANDYRTGNVLTGWYTTTNAGETWTTGTFPLQPGFSFAGDPCVAFHPNGDVTVVFMNYNGPGGSAVTSHSSTDGGVTWSPRTTIDLAFNNDKPQLDIDRSSGPNRGDVATAWVRFAGGDNIWASTSSDPTNGWTAAQQINESAGNNAIATDVAYGANSALYVMWANRGTNTIWVDRSFDGGQTFAPDVRVTSYNAVPSPIPGSVFRMFDIFAMSADVTNGPFGGKVYVGYHNWNTNGAQRHSDIRCVSSSDQGATWTQDVIVNLGDKTSSDQVFPGVRVDEKGNVNISYYDRRLDPSNQLLWTWVARSSDGGATFAEYQASDVGWNHRPTEFGGSFIGDYMDVDCSANAVFPFWCDGRSGTQDVFVDRLYLDFFTDRKKVSATEGGAVTFHINVGPNYAGTPYIVLGTLSGTRPGVPLGGNLTLPLNPDPFTNATVALANSSFLPNTSGVLDATGSATAGFNTLGPIPGTAGLRLNFAVLVFLPIAPVFATNSARIEIVP